MTPEEKRREQRLDNIMTIIGGSCIILMPASILFAIWYPSWLALKLFSTFLFLFVLMFLITKLDK